MYQTNDSIWLAFEALAKTYPHDKGVRITADLARWLLEESQRANVQLPPIIEKIVCTVTPAPDLQLALRAAQRR
jgi:hypothetical protein